MGLVGLIFRLQVHQTEVDATYLLVGTCPVTSVPHTGIEQSQLAF